MRIHVPITVIALMVAGVTDASAKCDVPKFKIGSGDDDPAPSLHMSISVSPDDITLQSMFCLASAFKARYPDRDTILIRVFTNPTAAKYYSGSGLVPEGAKTYANDLRAFYYFDSKRQIHQIGIGDFNRPDSLISLPTAQPRCLTLLGDRCLLGMKALNYPQRLAEAGVSGSVTMTGTITRDGRVTDARPLDPSSNPPGHEEQFATECLRHVQTLRFEEAKHEGAFRATYSWATLEAGPGDSTTRLDLTVADHLSLKRSKP